MNIAPSFFQAVCILTDYYSGNSKLFVFVLLDLDDNCFILM